MKKEIVNKSFGLIVKEAFMFLLIRVVLLALEKQRIQAETENAKAEARKTVETQQILAQTSNIELARKQ